MITLKDHAITYLIDKCDEEGNPVSGVKLVLKDRDTGEEIPLENDGITKDEPLVLDKVLIAGHTYILHEEEAVPGVHTAADITFTTQLYGQKGTVKIRMIDQSAAITIRKCDEDGNALAGAKLIIYETDVDADGNTIIRKDESGNPIIAMSFVSGKEPYDVSDFLVGGKTYILHEEEAPDGYQISEDIVFTLEGTKTSPQSVLMTDREVPEDVETGIFVSARSYVVLLAASALLVAVLIRKK